MPGRWRIEGHAIVSDDDRIADAGGGTPAALRNPADWARFQAALDGAAVVALGRLGHEANPNRHHRNRLVLSSSARGVERRDEAWWWNPADAPLAGALAAAAPAGGIVAVPGGRRVFDLFLEAGYAAFHLARAAGVRIDAGPTVFSACTTGRSAEAVLAAAGLQADETEILDAAAGVSVTIWRNRAAAEPEIKS